MKTFSIPTVPHREVGIELPWARLVSAPNSSSTTGRLWRYFATKMEAEQCAQNTCGPATFRPGRAWRAGP